MKSDLFGFPTDIISDLPSVRLVGNTSAEVLNHKGVKECDTNKVCISTKLGVITVLGRSLIIKEINGDCLKIEGNIKSIAYE